MDQHDPYRVLREHQPAPVTGWRRLLGRPAGCRACGQRYPCAQHRAALDEFAPPRPPRVPTSWAGPTAMLPAAPLLTHGQTRRYRPDGDR